MKTSKPAAGRSYTGERGLWVTIILFVFGTALGILGHAGSVVNLMFPAAATLVACRLVFRSPPLYLGFTLWTWYLSPEIRRLVDFQIGFHSQSPVQLTPMLVSLVGLFPILRHASKLRQKRFLAFLLVLASLLEAYIIGLFNAGLFAASFDLVFWLAPISMSVYIIIMADQYPRVSAAFVKANVMGVLVIGSYGVYQFFRIPPWDLYWIQATNLALGGTEAKAVRVFGTMNISGVYAVAVAAGLIYALVSDSLLRWGAFAVGIPALATTAVRSAWGAFAIGLALHFWQQRGVAKLRMIWISALVVAIVIPIFTFGPIGAIFASRFSTFDDIQQDGSFRGRVHLYEDFLGTAFSSPLGQGLGSTGTAAKLGVGRVVTLDSGILMVPLVFGWGGALFFFGGVLLLVKEMIGNTRGMDRAGAAAVAVSVPILFEMIFTNTLTGVQGVWFWTGPALVMSHKYWKLRFARNQNPTYSSIPPGFESPGYVPAGASS